MNKVRWMLTIALITILSASRAQEIDLEKELIAFYPFTGNARNQVEDDLHGVETNVIYAEDRHGNAGSSCYVTGDNSYITIPHSEKLNWDARTESYSIVFWIRSADPNNVAVDGHRYITKWRELGDEPYAFSISCDDEFLGCAVYDGVEGYSCRLPGIWDDQWHHVAMIRDHASQTLSAYYDGVFLKSISFQPRISTRNIADIFIGRGKSPIREGFVTGYCDELYFYNRAINACEVETLYTGDLLNER